MDTRDPGPELLWAGKVVQQWDINLFDMLASVRAPDAAPYCQAQGRPAEGSAIPIELQNLTPVDVRGATLARRTTAMSRRT